MLQWAGIIIIIISRRFVGQNIVLSKITRECPVGEEVCDAFSPVAVNLPGGINPVWISVHKRFFGWYNTLQSKRIQSPLTIWRSLSGRQAPSDTGLPFSLQEVHPESETGLPLSRLSVLSTSEVDSYVRSVFSRYQIPQRIWKAVAVYGNRNTLITFPISL